MTQSFAPDALGQPVSAFGGTWRRSRVTRRRRVKQPRRSCGTRKEERRAKPPLALAPVFSGLKVGRRRAAAVQDHYRQLQRKKWGNQQRAERSAARGERKRGEIRGMRITAWRLLEPTAEDQAHLAERPPQGEESLLPNGSILGGLGPLFMAGFSGFTGRRTRPGTVRCVCSA